MLNIIYIDDQTQGCDPVLKRRGNLKVTWGCGV